LIRVARLLYFFCAEKNTNPMLMRLPELIRVLLVSHQLTVTSNHRNRPVNMVQQSRLLQVLDVSTLKKMGVSVSTSVYIPAWRSGDLVGSLWNCLSTSTVSSKSSLSSLALKIGKKSGSIGYTFNLFSAFEKNCKEDG